jgi:hypothetical protein
MVYFFGYLDAVELLDWFTSDDDLRVCLPDLGRGDAARQAV